MSNPGVIRLAEKKISEQNFRIEDNLGENIHIHYGNIRLDLSVEELQGLGNVMKKAIGELVAIEDVSIENLEPGFFTILAPYLKDLDNIEHTEMDVRDLWCVSEETGYRKKSLEEVSINGDIVGGTQYEVSLFNKDNVIVAGLGSAVEYIRKSNVSKIPVTRYNFKNGKHSVQLDKLYQSLEMIDKCEKIIKEEFDKLPDNAKIAFRGGGLHMEKFQKLMPKSMTVACVIEKSAVKNYDLQQRKIIPVSQIKQVEFDTVVICSLKYRKEMKQELLELFDGRVIDFYEIFKEKLGSDFEYPYYMIEYLDKKICI